MEFLKQYRKLLMISGGSIVGVLLVIFLGMLFLNKNTLELNVSDGDKVHFEYGSKIEELDVEALYKGTIFNKDGTPIEIQIEGNVDYTKLGEYEVRVLAQHKKQAVAADITIVVEDTLPPVIELVSDPEYFTNPSAEYEEEGYHAVDNHDGDVTALVKREENDGTVSYTVTDSSGNSITVEREIVYKDVIAPVITLNGETEISLNVGGTYTEPGYSATDECDGDLSQNVTVEGTVDCSTNGVYTISYKVTDSSGNEGEVLRTVKVLDLSAPVITLNGDREVYVHLGDAYVEPGYQAVDNVDGDVNAKVTIDGKVDTSRVGSYSITYLASDSSGNTSSETRNVYVYEKQAENVVVNPGDKVVYLTFDDGPGPYTARLLDILDKYGVKVTFFVTGQFSDYYDMIGEAHDRGHTIAMHTFTHRFQDIYASTSAYYNDLEMIKNLCVEQTGEEPWLLRFPGGTANTVSKKYCPGIMSSISKGVGYRGYLYCDWNVDSNDSAGTETASGVVHNVIEGIRKKDVAIVLQHDIQKHSVDAVEEIICWGLSNGYKFLALEESSPLVHGTVRN